MQPRTTNMKRASITLALAGALTGCVARQQAINTEEYVEIDSPLPGEAGDANAKIWVPKSSLETGVPRGRDLAKLAYQAASLPVLTDAAVSPVKSVRLRVLVAESGRQLLAPALIGLVSKKAVARQVAPPSPAEALTEQEALSYLATLGADAPSGPVLLLSKPEGTRPGGRLKADLYDVRGPLLLRSFWVAVPEPAKGETEKDALLAAVNGLAETTVKSLAWFPWYGKVVTLSGERVYLDAGKETGLKVGLKVAVYRGGEVVKGIGFAPGNRIATLTISELFGADGAIGRSPEAARIKPGDYLELDNQPQQ